MKRFLLIIESLKNKEKAEKISAFLYPLYYSSITSTR